MEPKQFYKNLEKKNFPMFTRGDIILTNHHKSWLAKLIRFKGKLEGDDPLCNHVEMYLLTGHSIGANRRVDVKGIEKFFKGKHDVYVFHRKGLTSAHCDKLVAEALRYLNKPYNYTGLLWQALDGITFSSFFSGVFNRDFLVYCSELLQRVYKKALNMKIATKKVGSATPDNIMDYLEKQDRWVCKLTMYKKDKEWRYGDGTDG
jgi:hypothetical protein